MEPYNHEEGNIIVACGFTEDQIEQFKKFDSPELILENCPKRFMAMQVQAACDMDKSLGLVCANTKFSKIRVPKIDKYVHPALDALVRENLKDLPTKITENYILFQFARYHYKMISMVKTFYSKKSKTVEFLENNYTKEELLLILMQAFIVKNKANMISEIIKKEKDGAKKALLATLQELMTDNNAQIEFTGKEYSDTELGITSFDEEVINREIDQNIVKEDWLKGTNVFQIHGASTECAMSTNGIELREAMDSVFNTDMYTPIEKACHVENILWNKHKHNKKNYGEEPAMLKVVIEMLTSKNQDWRHKIALHDRIARVYLFKANNITQNDVEYLVNEVF